MARPIMYCLPLSTYTHSVRLALEEKQAEHDFVAMPPGTGKQPPHLACQPWGTIPAFEPAGFALYEPPALLGDMDVVFTGMPCNRATLSKVRG
jgi:glutathione S-transferase